MLGINNLYLYINPQNFHGAPNVAMCSADVLKGGKNPGQCYKL